MPTDRQDQNTGFEEVLHSELDWIERSRKERGITTAEEPRAFPPAHARSRARRAQLLGLALSGGGIRSATFNLGILQALARLQLLHRVDYLSTVSGGGYIGSWLIGWLRRQSRAEVAERKRLQSGRSATRTPEGGGSEAVRASGGPEAQASGRSPAATAFERVLKALAASGTVERMPGENRKRAEAATSKGGSAASARGGAEDGASEASEPDSGSMVQHLREYSNYLTPRASLLSADAAHATGAIVRNLLLNQIILVLPALALLFALVALDEIFSAWADSDKWCPAVGLALLLFTLSITIVAYNITTLYESKDIKGQASASPKKRRRSFARSRVVLFLAVFPFLFACWIASVPLWMHRDKAFPSGWPVLLLIAMFFGYGGMWFVAWIVGGLVKAENESKGGEEAQDAASGGNKPPAGPWSRRAMTMGERLKPERSGIGPKPLMGTGFAAGAVGGGLLLGISRWMKAWPDPGYGFVFGGALVALAFVVTVWLHVGLMGRALPEEAREWTGRFTGTLLLSALAFFVACGIAVHGPSLLGLIGTVTEALLASSWVATTIGGVLLAREDASVSGLRRGAITFALNVFLLGLLVVLAAGVSYLLEWDWVDLENLTTGIRVVLLLTFGLVFFLVAFFLSWRVDVNDFSLHSLYRNRLIRCYLGASNGSRDPNPWVDLDPADDDVKVSELAPSKEGYVGPYPLLNVTLNLAGSDNLSRQTRKAKPFVFAPCFSGFEADRDRSSSRRDKLSRDAYRPTPEYAGNISLGRAMAISGAAASPNMGHFTDGTLSVMMTIFNVRLGSWLGNPRRPKYWKKSSPVLGLLYLLLEMFARTTEKSRYVYLSDGGHFDNLGIYELVKRRCRFIIACDAEQDSDFSFGGLGNAVERCRIDLGADIRIDVDALRRGAAEKPSRWHCAVGRIHYDSPAGNESEIGTLVYVKASLTGDEPADVLRYSRRNSSFPHQTTLDQWFDETQFESYRALGEHVALSVFRAHCGKERLDLASTEDLFIALRKRWYPRSERVRESFSRHGEVLSSIHDAMRNSEHLDFLEAQIYPEWWRLPPQLAGSGVVHDCPDGQERFRRAFHVCSEMLQLMENVYLDLDLEDEANHPDNRGWMSLFMQWSRAEAVRVTWAITSGTYGARFREWCGRELKMTPGEVCATPIRGKDGEEELTLFERELLRQVGRAEPWGERAVWKFVLAVPGPRTRRPGTAPVLARLPFGFAVLEGRQIRYFRIQHHARGTELARKALSRLDFRAGPLVFDPARARRALLGAPLEERVVDNDINAFERLFDSVQLQRGSRRESRARAEAHPGER